MITSTTPTPAAIRCWVSASSVGVDPASPVIGAGDSPRNRTKPPMKTATVTNAAATASRCGYLKVSGGWFLKRGLSVSSMVAAMTPSTSLARAMSSTVVKRVVPPGYRLGSRQGGSDPGHRPGDHHAIGLQFLAVDPASLADHDQAVYRDLAVEGAFDADTAAAVQVAFPIDAGPQH